MTEEEKIKAKELYLELKNYSAVGRLLGYCSETIRYTLNEDVKRREQERWTERGTKYYHAKYKTNSDKIEAQRIRARDYRCTDRAKELAKERYIKDRATGRNRYKKCSDSQRAHVIRRRDRKKNLKENFTKDDVKYTKDLFLNRCAVCGSIESLCLDHWYPLSRGYPLTRENAVILCSTCNSKKSNKLPYQVYSQEVIDSIESKLSSTCPTATIPTYPH